MAEILTLCVGRFGIQLGNQFFETIAREHSIDLHGFPSNEGDIHGSIDNVYFQENPLNGKKFPRALLIDSDPTTFNTQAMKRLQTLYSPDYLVKGSQSFGNVWTKAYYTEGAEMIDEIRENVRKAVETCDILQGFQLLHSLGGATGSGLGTLLVDRLQGEDFMGKTFHTYSLFPSESMTDTVVEPINAILGFRHLYEYSCVHAFENESLHGLTESMQIHTYDFSELNKLIVNVMSGISCGLRFHSETKVNMRKYEVNMCPYPLLHFFQSSFGPLRSRYYYQRIIPTVREIVSHVSDPNNFLSSRDEKYVKQPCITSCSMFRGNFSSAEVEFETSKNNIGGSFSTLCTSPHLEYSKSCTYIENSAKFLISLKRIYQKFSMLFKRKAFLFRYTGEGMDSDEFQECQSILQDIIEEYQNYFQGSEYSINDEILKNK